MKEVHRVYGIHAGIIIAVKKYPNQYLLQVVAGILKGMKYLKLDRNRMIVCGCGHNSWTPATKSNW